MTSFRALAKGNLPWLHRRALLGDLGGGVTAAMVSLPLYIGFGLLAFAPLGEAYAAQGITAGFLGAIVAGLVKGVAGGGAGLIWGPGSVSALVFAALVGDLLAGEPGAPGDPGLALGLAFTAVALAGLLQMAFGLGRLGNLVKYVPYPVVAGFLNGTCLLVIAGQVWHALGVAPGGSLLELPQRLGEARPLAAGIALATALVAWLGSRRQGRIPSGLLALGAGYLLYHLLDALGLAVGPTLGRSSAAFPIWVPALPQLDGAMRAALLENLPLLFASAATMALISATSTLLTGVLIQDHTRKRSDANRELLGQGVANLATGLLGGLASRAYTSSSLVNVHAGGRTRLSSLVCALLTACLLFLLTPLVATLPYPVLAGIVIVVMIRLFDLASLRGLGRLDSPRRLWRDPLVGSAVTVVAVALTTLVANLLAAMALGVFLSLLHFAIRFGPRSVRRSYSGAEVRSRKQRREGALAALREHGKRIRVLELEGALFFGSMDQVVAEIERLRGDGAKYLVLDLKRVRDVDSTAVHLLGQVSSRLREEGCWIGMSHVADNPALSLLAGELDSTPGRQALELHQDTDAALERCEDLLLRERAAEAPGEAELPVERLEILRELPPADVAGLRPLLRRLAFGSGEVVFRQGDPGDALFFIARGVVDVVITLPSGSEKRVQSFAEGTFFGEMSVLDGESRSATVVARSEVVCYRLGLGDFEELRSAQPQLFIQVLLGVSRALSARVRYAVDIIRETDA